MNLISLSLIVVLLAGNALFVGAEFAIVSARRTQLEPLAAAGSRRARTALTAMSHVSIMLAASQLGITICSLGLGAVAEPGVTHALHNAFASIGLPERAMAPVGFIVALALVSYAHMVLGEMVAKNLAVSAPERFALWLAPPLVLFSSVTRPLLVALNACANVVVRMVGARPTDEVKTVYTAEELASLMSESRSEGLLRPEVHDRLSAALTLPDRTAGEVTIPWAAVHTVSDDISPASLELMAVRTRLSRFPVIDRQTRQVAGFIHIKDILGISGEDRRAPIDRAMVRPLKVIPLGMPLPELLLTMRRDSSHLVLVSNDGVPQGVVTLQDVLATVVGGDR